MIEFTGMTQTENILMLTMIIFVLGLLLIISIFGLIDYFNNRHHIKKVKNYTPIKFPDKLKIKQYKNQYYLIKNNKRKYLTANQLNKLYHAYINPFKRGDRDYPTRVVKI